MIPIGLATPTHCAFSFLKPQLRVLCSLRDTKAPFRGTRIYTQSRQLSVHESEGEAMIQLLAILLQKWNSG